MEDTDINSPNDQNAELTCEEDLTDHAENTANNLSPPELLCNIEEFVETSIIFRKDKSNDIGIGVIGGNDSYLESICVSEVYKDGAAYQDGRLKSGDVLLAINDVSLRNVSLKEAIKILREASSPVRLVVLRENPETMFTCIEEPTKFITVELRKAKVTDRLGLSIFGKKDGVGVFITWIHPHSVASENKRLRQGDRILEINGQSVKHLSQAEVATLLRNVDGAVVLLLGRIPFLTASIQEWARNKNYPIRSRMSTWSHSMLRAREDRGKGNVLNVPQKLSLTESTSAPPTDSPSVALLTPGALRTRSNTETRLQRLSNKLSLKSSDSAKRNSITLCESRKDSGITHPNIPYIEITSF
uniref:Eka-INAD2 protein n=1 Tax=Euperipatoides kanangrensis TaxID=488523 RepID=A0A0F7VHJ3_9BILA|nr:Eka-INAD2 protein [Euperipatoides kanangrensis]